MSIGFYGHNGLQTCFPYVFAGMKYIVKILGSGSITTFNFHRKNIALANEVLVQVSILTDKVSGTLTDWEKRMYRYHNSYRNNKE